MDAIRLLKNDHKEVEGLFKELEGLSDGAKASRKRLFQRIDEALTMHAKIEETIFYPAFKARTSRDKDAKQDVLEAYEEHANVKAMIKKLEALEPSDETYQAKLQVLHELVKHHVKEEEHTMFPEAKRLLGADELDRLGEEMEQVKNAGEPAPRKTRTIRGTTGVKAASEAAR